MASASSSRSTARRSRASPTRGITDVAASTVNIDHHHDNTRFGDVNLVVADASSTAEVLADSSLTRPRADARDRRGALHRARHRHRPLPVLEHDPEGAAARGRPRRGGRRRLTGSSRRSTSRCSSPKLKLLARALERATISRGRALVVSYLLARRLRRGRAPRSRTRRGSSTTCARSRAPSWRASSASRRAGRPRDRKVSLRLEPTSSTCRRSRGSSAAAGTGRRPASRATCPIEEITAFIVREFAAAPTPRPAAPADGDPQGARPDRGRPRRQAGGSVVVRDRRRRARAGPAPRPATRARSTRSRPGCCPALGSAHEPPGRFVGLDKRYVDRHRSHRAHDDRRPRGRAVERHEPPGRRGSSRRRSPASAATSSCRSRLRPP